MNHSEEVTDMIIMSVPLGDYCFAYVDEDLTVQVSTKSNEQFYVILRTINLLFRFNH